MTTITFQRPLKIRRTAFQDLAEFLLYVQLWSENEPVELRQIPDEEVTPAMRKKAEKVCKLYKKHPERFLNI